jgi:recombination protein RecT
LQKHGVQYSQSYKKGFGVWKDNFDAMAKKTVLKLMLNKGDAPMSVQMQQAIKYDQSVILDENGTARYIDNQAKPSNEEQVQQFLNAEEAQVVDNPTEAAETAEPAKPEGGSNLFDGKE